MLSVINYEYTQKNFVVRSIVHWTSSCSIRTDRLSISSLRLTSLLWMQMKGCYKPERFILYWVSKNQWWPFSTFILKCEQEVYAWHASHTSDLCIWDCLKFNIFFLLCSWLLSHKKRVSVPFIALFLIFKHDLANAIK